MNYARKVRSFGIVIHSGVTRWLLSNPLRLSILPVATRKREQTVPPMWYSIRNSCWPSSRASRSSVVQDTLYCLLNSNRSQVSVSKLCVHTDLNVISMRNALHLICENLFICLPCSRNYLYKFCIALISFGLLHWAFFVRCKKKCQVVYL